MSWTSTISVSSKQRQENKLGHSANHPVKNPD